MSGFLRNSDMVMYDRQTETLWQQFTGQGLIYRHTSDGYKVYSVGDDKKDDGGNLPYDKKPTDWGIHVRLQQ